MHAPDQHAAVPGDHRGVRRVRDNDAGQVERLLVALSRWAVRPEDVLAGNPTALLGLLWATGGAWVLLSVALGGFSEERPGLALAVGCVALVTGTGLRRLQGRALPLPGNVALTLLGSVAIVVVVAAGGAGVSGAATGVLFVYVTCFAFVAVPRQAVALVVVSAAVHLVALLRLGVQEALPVWLLTWGTATVAGILAGAVVHQLVDATARLRAADVAKDQFVASVSHELRSPLSAILLAVETLRDHEADVSPHVHAELLGVVRRQAERQQRLVEDVLLLSRRSAGAGVPRPASVDVRSLVHETVEALALVVEVRVDDVPPVLADAMHLQRVLDNLLVNADRYGAPPLEVHATRDGDWVVVDVVDHGDGIPGGFDGGALEPFRQSGPGEAFSGPGVGLGLAIVRDLVAANGGRLSYLDIPGGGATVRTLWRIA